MNLSKIFLHVLVLFFSLNLLAKNHTDNNEANERSGKPPINPYITVVSPQDLQSVRVSIEKILKQLQSEDEILKSEINFGDGYVSAKKDEIHTYEEAGFYTISIQVWKKSALILSLSKKIEVDSDFKVKDLANPPLLSENNIENGDHFSFRLDPKKLDKIYKLTFKRIKKTNFIEDFVIAILNVLHIKTSLNTFSANVEINDISVFQPNEINDKTTVIEKFVVLEKKNEVEIKWKPKRSNTVSLEIREVEILRTFKPPVITSSTTSDSLTNNPKISVSVASRALVKSQVFKDGVLFGTFNTKQFSFLMTEGINNFEIRSVDTFGNVAQPLVIQNVTLDTIPPIILSENKSIYYFQSVPTTINYAVTTNEPTVFLKVDGNDSIKISGTEYSFSEVIPTTAPVSHVLSSQDLAGNQSSIIISYSIIIDNVSPVIAIDSIPALTNLSSVLVRFNVTDTSPTETVIKVNGIEVARVSEKTFSYLLNLTAEGLNTIEAISTDAAGNVSAVASQQITKDTTAPVLSNLNPADGSTAPSSSFEVSGMANEELSEISVNGMALLLSADNKSFYGTYVASAFGVNTLNWVAKDLIGNQSSVTTTVQLLPPLLVSSLVSVMPDSDQIHYRVIGLAGAARPNANITVSAGALSFNSGSDIAKADGTFSVRLNKFTTVTVKAIDPNTNEQASFDLNFNVKTSIAGVIKDTNDLPLDGATIRILGTSISAVSDGNGVFTINEAPIGDQTISIDGSTISQTTTGAQRKFSVTNISVSVSPGKVNAMPRPIYLTATMLDGTGTTVVASAPASVTDINSPGVTIYIPTGKAIFPDGSSAGHISMTNIPVSKTVFPPPSGVMPDEVIALEPSGLKFTERVDVTFPNVNNLKEGTEVYVLSLNSISGQWEIDGVAKVEPGGQTIATKPGFGISHFSEDFLMPVTPLIESVQDPSLDGIDTAKGAMETSVSLPSFKSLGQDITPMLKYKTSWANPTAFVSNIFDIPKFEIKFSDSASVHTIDSIQGSPYICIFGACSTRQYTQEVYAKEDYTFNSAYIPDEISAQSWVGINSTDDQNYSIVNQPISSTDLPGAVLSNSIKTSKWTLVNDAEGTKIPNMSQISFGIPLQKQDGTYLSSGIYPSFTRYQVKLKHLIITTSLVNQYIKINGETYDPGTFTRSTRTVKSYQLDQILPKDLNRNILVQNKVDSAAGRGWNFNLAQKMINTKGSKILLEDAAGQVSTYSVAMPIETLFNANGTDINLQYGAGLNSWPNIYVSSYGSDKIGRIKKIDGNSPSSIATISQLEDLSGSTGFDNVDACSSPAPGAAIKLYKFNFKQKPGISNVISFPDGRLMASNSAAGSIIDVTNPTSTTLGGYRTIAGNGYTFNLNTGISGFSSAQQSLCGTLNLDCTPLVDLNQTQACGTAPTHHDESGTLSLNATSVPSANYSTLTDFSGGVVNYSGSFGTTNYSSVGFNNPTGMIVSPDGKLVVADTGSNVVFKINTVTGTIKIIAGNYSTNDNGDGTSAAPNVTYDLVKIDPIKNLKDLIFSNFVQKAFATALNSITSYGGAGIYHPKGLAYDADGNLYITSEHGYIRKVTDQGIISTYAGKSLEAGGTLADNIHAELMVFNNPTGLVIDSDKQEMFVADTGSNRIIKIDMTTKVASVVAGSSSCDPINPNDGGSALNASLCAPTWLGFDSNKNLLVIDSGHQRIRRIMLNQATAPLLTYLPSSNDLSYLEKQTDGSFIKKARNGSQLFFNQKGLQTSAMDRIGRTVTYNYDDQDRIISIVDPVGQTSHFNYSGTKISSFQDPSNRITRFNYENDFLSAIIYPDNTQKTFQYDTNSRMIKESDQNGYQIQYGYNSFGRLASTIDQAGNISNLADKVSATMQNPQREGLGTNKVNSNVTLANNSSIKLTADANGIMRKVQDGLGRITEIESDLEGKPIITTLPDSTKIQYAYDITTKDLLKVTNLSTGLAQSQTYNQFGQVLTKTDFNANTTQNIYTDMTGLLVSQVLPNNVQVTASYNFLGLPISKTVYPSGQSSLTTSYIYDGLGNKIKVISPDGKMAQYTYDAVGNVLSATTSKNSTTSFTTFYDYDLFNRLTKVTSPKGEITQYVYLKTGQLAQITDPKGQVTLFTYDNKGQLIQKTDPEGSNTVFQYDAIGNVIQETNPNGQVKTFQYNASNKVIRATLPEETIDYAYDLKDQVTDISSSDGNKISYGRDLNNRLLQETNFWNTLSYVNFMDYDQNGNRISTKIYSNNFTASLSGGGNLNYLNQIFYTYDANNRLTSLSNSWGDSFSYNYDQANRLTSMLRPGSRTDYTYNAGSALASIIHSTNNSTSSFSQFSYDNQNMITQKRNPAGTFDYSYDANAQLIKVDQSLPAGTAESFTYDEVGNRLSTGLYAQTYDSSNQRIQDDGMFTYVYDNNGNIISKNSKTGGQSFGFQYSSKNQLVTAIVLAAPLGQVLKTINYKYDPVGRRIERAMIDNADSTRSVTKKFVYDGENIISELDGNNRLMASYTHSLLSADDILAVHFTNHAVKVSSGGDALSDDYVMSPTVGNYYYLKDHLNTVTDVTDNLGNIIERFDYTAYGVIRSVKNNLGVDVGFSAAPVKTSFTFTGREYEPELGTYYYRARYYDPNTGRFLQKDPDPGKLADPRTFLSKYVYVANSPAMFSDSSGKFWWIIAIAVATGIFQGINNVNAAKEAGYGGDKLLQTFFVGFVSGALQGGVAAVAGPWWGLAAAFAGGAVNNAGNQRIFNPSSDGIDLGQSFKSGGYSAAGFAFGAGLGYAAGGTLGLNVGGGGFGSADAATGVVGLIGSHIPGNAAPNGISRCQDSLNCQWYNPSTGERK